MDKTIENKQRKDKVEKCISCGKDTPYLRTTPIQERDFYIVGLGQVCHDCYKKLKYDIVFVESEE